jgi:SAM-dependent methyltransferase
MADTAQEPDAGTGWFDFYGAHYRRFGGGLAAALRREAYRGGDVGQTGWRTGDEQADIADLVRLGPDVHFLDVACGSGGPSLDLAERTGCRVTGLDLEPAGIARAEAQAAARGLAGRATFRVLDCGNRLPFADGAFGAVLCVDAVVHLPDRFAVLREWARLLRPGGRLLFADAAVLTGPVGKADLDARAANGAFLLVPPGCNEAAVAAAGLTLLRREDRTEAVAGIAGRWHAARARHAPELEREEGADWFARRQRFLEVTAELAASRRLSRFLYLAERPAEAAPGSLPVA